MSLPQSRPAREVFGSCSSALFIVKCLAAKDEDALLTTWPPDEYMGVILLVIIDDWEGSSDEV